MKFLDVKTDFAFKKVFGSEQSKEILISFINALVYQNSAFQITDLTIVDPYNIPMLKGMKDTYVDVSAVLNDGSRVIIEMQVLNHPGLEKRVLYNAAKNYSIQLKKGEDYHLLNPVIAITIVDFSMFETKHVMSRFKLMEKEQMIEYSDDIELIFFELPKFNKTAQQLDSLHDKWLYFLQNAGTLDLIPQSMEDEFSHAFNIINEANLSESELEAQHKRKEFIYIQKSSIEMAHNKGLDQGLKQGVQKTHVQTILTGVKLGYSITDLCALTGLSASDIELIIENHEKTET